MLTLVGGKPVDPRRLRGGDRGHVGGGEPERGEIRVGAQRSVRFGTRSVKGKSTELDGHSPSPRGRRLKRRIGTRNVVSHDSVSSPMDSAACSCCPAHAALGRPTATQAVNRHAGGTSRRIDPRGVRLHQRAESLCGMPSALERSASSIGGLAVDASGGRGRARRRSPGSEPGCRCSIPRVPSSPKRTAQSRRRRWTSRRQTP